MTQTTTTSSPSPKPPTPVLVSGDADLLEDADLDPPAITPRQLLNLLG